MKKRNVKILASLFVPALVILILLFIKHWGSPPGPDAAKNEISGSLEDFNLVFIIIDALRADHLGCYGYSRNTTPVIDSLARDALVFDSALSNSSFTAESVSVLMTGRLPSSGGSTGWGARPAKDITHMAEMFKKSGYRTAFFSNSNVLKGRSFNKGFDQTWHCEKWGVSGNSPELSKKAVEFIKENKSGKFMVYLHYLDPHGPYQPPREYHLKFTDEIFSAPLGIYAFVRKNIPTLLDEGFGPGDPRFRDLVIRYDAEIALVDHSIGLLARTLEELALDKKTLLVITSDHGEEFLEHKFVEHAWTLYKESLHIPLIFRAPGKIAGKRIGAPVSTVDFLPTFLQIMKIPHEREDFDGTALFKKSERGFRFVPVQKPHIAELQIQHRNLLRSVTLGKWKYIAARRWLSPWERHKVLVKVSEFEQNSSLHLDIWGPVVREELYDLEKDPGETVNLVAAFPQKVLELKKILESYRIYCLKYGKKRAEDTNKLSKEEMEKLKSLGYL